MSVCWIHPEKHNQKNDLKILTFNILSTVYNPAFYLTIVQQVLATYPSTWAYCRLTIKGMVLFKQNDIEMTKCF